MPDPAEEEVAQATSRLSIRDDEKANPQGRPWNQADMAKSSSALLDFAPPTQYILGDKRVWDITDKFRKVASVLPPGILVKDENFTLFESVGALEIMDSKMDSGFLAPGEALVDDYDLERPLLPEEVIGVIDQFLCCEMAWHEGYPLAQTLFSSHYIDQLLSLEAKAMHQIHFTPGGKDNMWSNPLLHVVLRAYSIAIIKCCDYALEEINRSLDGGGTRTNFYEEEDFCGHTYGRELFTRIPIAPILELLLMASEFIESEKSFSLKGQRQSPPEIYNALQARLEFRMLLLRAMAAEEDIDNKVKYWQDIPKTFLDIKSTHKLGKTVSESFSPKIQRRLASTVPPKPMVELSFEDAFAKLEQMCQDCQEAVKIINFGPYNVESLKAFLWSFSSRKPEPWAYPRACLSTPLFSCDDAGFEELLRKDLENLVLPEAELLDPANWTEEAPQSSTAAQNPRLDMAKTINQFTQLTTRMPGGYVDFFRALTSNRCRVRRNLVYVANALEDIQTRETEHLDEIIDKLSPNSLKFPLSTWTYHRKLCVMEWIVQLGFELDIYLPDELAGMYWYLSVLSLSRISLLELILPHIENQLSKSNMMKRSHGIEKSIALLRSLKLEAQGTMALATALNAFYTYLFYLGLIPQVAAKSPFKDSLLRYEIRMKPFLSISSPELPSYDEWEEVLLPFGQYAESNTAFNLSKSNYLYNMEEEIKKAKGHFAELKKLGAAAAGCEGVETTWSKNIAALLQSCIATGLALSALKTADSKLKLEIPEPGKGRYHDWWIVPKLIKIDAV